MYVLQHHTRERFGLMANTYLTGVATIMLMDIGPGQGLGVYTIAVTGPVGHVVIIGTEVTGDNISEW